MILLERADTKLRIFEDSSSADTAVREAAAALRELLDAPRWKPNEPLALPWRSKSLGRIRHGMDPETGSQVPDTYTNWMIVTEELVSLHMKRGQFREAMEHLDEKMDKKLLSRITLPAEYRANMLVNLLHCELESGRVVEALDSSEDSEKRLFPADKDLKDAVLSTPAWHLLNARTYFYHFAWDMALAECEQSNEVRQKFSRDLEGQLHTWRDVIYAWCMGQKRLDSGTRGDIMDALASWQTAVDEERLRVQENPRFSTCWYLRFVLMALSNCGYAMQSEDSRVEVHKILLEKCEQLLQDLSEDPRARGDPLLRKARRVIKTHSLPDGGGVRRSVLHVDATACGTLARWIKHSTQNPNVEFDTYYTQPGGLAIPGVGVKTIKPIHPGDIITADYGPPYQVPKAALRGSVSPGPYQADFPYLSTVLNGLATSTSPLRPGRLFRMIESLARIEQQEEATVRRLSLEEYPEVLEEDKFYLDEYGNLKAGPETHIGAGVYIMLYGGVLRRGPMSYFGVAVAWRKTAPCYRVVQDPITNTYCMYNRAIVSSVRVLLMSKEWSYSGPPTRRAPPPPSPSPSVADGPGLDRYGADGGDTRMAGYDDDYIRARLVNRLGNDFHYYYDHRGVHDNDTPVSAPCRATQVEDGGGSISSSSRSGLVPEDDPWRRRTAPESSKNRMMPTSSSHDPSQQPDDYRVTDSVVLKDSHWTMLEGGFSCSLCDTTVVHEAQLRDHIKGKRHQKHLNYLQWERSSHSDSDGNAAAGVTAANVTITTTPSGRLSTRADSAGVVIHHSCPTMDEKHAGAATAIRPSEHNSSSSHGRTPPDPASGWMDDSEMEDYTKQCNRQFWTPAGEPRTDGLVDFEGSSNEE
ncbi:hypothetical protein FOZ61_008484 [Perkinsus olseni]|uniref:C2H2-type domain-containing protein n=1 Tax=Perkinsus olseni TaxID=32597 RepID=A0A7J6L4Q3_PEROL|nr:hypothetical protein FOZ61_008484 [Perkinsus olseni]